MDNVCMVASHKSRRFLGKLTPAGLPQDIQPVPALLSGAARENVISPGRRRKTPRFPPAYLGNPMSRENG